MMVSSLKKSDMILAVHTDTGFLNESEASIQAGAFIFLSENEPKPNPMELF